MLTLTGTRRVHAYATACNWGPHTATLTPKTTTFTGNVTKPNMVRVTNNMTMTSLSGQFVDSPKHLFNHAACDHYGAMQYLYFIQFYYHFKYISVHITSL